MEHSITGLEEIGKKQVLVIGGGVSGMAAAAFLQSKGAAVTLADQKPREEAKPELLDLENQGVTLCLGGMPEVVDCFDFAVISPGIPLTVPVAQALRQKGIEIIGELELAYLFAHSPFLAITGTNGKTTTTSLVGYILRQAGVNCMIGGNIGTPLITRVEALPREAYIVAEVSSFQLETTERFTAHVAAYLNLTPDHLNRHGTLEAYGNIKARIFANQQKDDVTVLNYDDQAVRAYGRQTNGRVVYFSRKKRLEQGVFVENGVMVAVSEGRKTTILPINEIFIKGGHNIENALAATAMALAVHIRPEVIAEALRTFPGVEHRQEFVAEKRGVIYINDSKGTNPDSTMQALLAYDKPMVLILGGRNKGGDFTPLLPLIRQKVKQVVLVGEAAPEIRRVLEDGGYHAIVEAGNDFAKTVELAVQAAVPGDIVMLSPACASWDMFPSLEVRGELFKKLVNGL